MSKWASITMLIIIMATANPRFKPAPEKRWATLAAISNPMTPLIANNNVSFGGTRCPARKWPIVADALTKERSSRMWRRQHAMPSFGGYTRGRFFSRSISAACRTSEGIWLSNSRSMADLKLSNNPVTKEP